MQRVFDLAAHLGVGRASGDAEPSRLKLVVLNQPIWRLDIFLRLWQNTVVRVCADGGANRLFEAFSPDQEGRIHYLPTEIVGDLDSLRDDVREFYAGHAVRITHMNDQESTDFGKSMKVLRSSVYSGATDIVIFGSIGGRVDQGIGLLHEILREHHHDPLTRLWLISEASLSFLLPPGENVIETSFSKGYVGKKIGILPVYGPATISTKGLEWDVKDWHTAMGGAVSTSNHIIQDTVRVTTDSPVLFTVQMAPRLPDQS